MGKRSTNFNGRKNRMTARGLLGLMDALEISPEEQRQIVERAKAREAASPATVEQAATVAKETPR